MPLALLSAPTNLGLRPPIATATPGVAKAPEALREAGLHRRMTARDAGVVVAGRYVDDYVPGAGRIRNQDAILSYSMRLAGRISALLDGGETPLILGGDCSVLLGVGAALRARGRFGLLHVDGHTDFRHPGNSDACASLAGEDLAAAVGLHWPAIANLGGGRHFDPSDVVHVGCRDDDEHLAEVRARLPLAISAAEATLSIDDSARAMREVLARAELDGYWLHLDVDVLDATAMPAVDSPSTGGLSPDDLVRLLRLLAPGAVGAHVTVFDPDLDPDGSYAGVVTDCVVNGLSGLGTSAKQAHAAEAD